MAGNTAKDEQIDKKFLELVLSIILSVSLAEFLLIMVNNISPLVSWGFFSILIVAFYLLIVYRLLATKSNFQENKLAYITKIVLVVLLIMLPYVFLRSITSSTVDKLETIFVFVYVILLPAFFSIWRYAEIKTWKDWEFGIGILLSVIMIGYTILSVVGL